MAATIFVLTSLFVVLATMLIRIAYNYWFIPLQIQRKLEKQGIRGPKPKFLVGNTTHVAALVAKSTSLDMETIDHDIVSRLLPHFAAWSNQYGKRFVFWNGVEPRMCLMETELIKELLSKYSMISGKSWLQRQGSKHFIGRGLLMANGDDWHRQRLILAPAFRGEALKRAAEGIFECCKKSMESLQNAVSFGDGEIEIGEHMAQLTADIICQTQFGSSYEKGKQIFHLLTDLQKLSSQSSSHLCLPGVRFFPNKYNKKIKSLKNEVEKLLMEIIESRRKCVEFGRSSSYGNDMLGLLLNETEKKNGDCNVELIIDECKTFFFAGHETTALLLTWTIMLLASNPLWQEKVRAEISELCGNNGGFPSLDRLSKMTQLNMVINETLRLYPPATILPRIAFEDIKLGDLEIPKGLSIWIPMLAINHSEELWGKDANIFNPERFANKSYATGRYFIPFAIGPRNCIGQTFAMIEAKIILSMLISRFSFKISESYKHAPIIILTIKPKYGVPICLKPLK